MNINCPIFSSLWSISKRAASHSCGAISHSSISRGVAPSSSRLEFVFARESKEQTVRTKRYADDSLDTLENFLKYYQNQKWQYYQLILPSI